MDKRKYDNEEHEAYIREHGDIQPDEDYEMDLSVSDRKKLWALSGNECAICKCKLVRKENSNTNVGEECHISSEKPDWPSKEFSRYEPDLEEDKRNNNIDNAILLCSNCHKIIDNPESTQFTIERLHQIKEEHEAEIRRSNQEETKKHEKLEQEKNGKLKLSRTLLSEIKANQNKLQPISDIVDELAHDCKESSEEVMLPNILHFNTNYFSSLSGKLELLDDDSRAKLFLYYSELEYVEEEYKELKLIHGETCTSLVIIQFKEASKTKIIKPGWNEIAIFLERTKKAYDLGEELITNLEEKTGINPVYNYSSLPIEHSRTRPHHDVRKLSSECENLKIRILEGKKKIREYITNKSREGISIYSKLDSIFDEGYISQNGYGEIVCRTEGDEISGLVGDYSTKNKLTKDEDYKEFVETIINDEPLFELFETVRKNKAELYEKTDEIEQCIENFEKRQALK